MPELPEIHRFGININQRCRGVVFTRLAKASHPKFENIPDIGPCTISAKVRGKELSLILAPVNASTNAREITWNFGLVGRFIVSAPNAIPPYALATWFSDQLALSYCDMQKMGRWREGAFDSKRGSDPVLNHAAFVKAVAAGVKSNAFQKPLAELLLNQDYFNGIGNYLRAEVCYRAGVSPFTPASDIFSSFSAEAAQYSFDEIQSSPSPASFSKAKMIMYLCRAIPLEVLEKGLNKYGNDQEQQVFHDWLRVYDKGEEKELQGRKVHYSKTLLATPDLPQLSNPPPSSYVGETYPPPNEQAYSSPSNLPSASSAMSAAPQAFPAPSITSSAAFAKAAVVNVPKQLNPATQFSGIPTTAQKDGFKFDVRNLAVFNESLKENARLDLSKTGQFPYSLLDVREVLLAESTSNMTRLLLLLSKLSKNGSIGAHDKDVLKVLALTSDGSVFGALKAFLADFDLDEFVDTLRHISNQGVPDHYALVNKDAAYPISPDQTSITSFAKATPPVSTPAPALVTPKSTVSSEPPPAPSIGYSSLTSGYSSVSRGYSSLPAASSPSTVDTGGVPSGLVDPEWSQRLASEFSLHYFKEIVKFVAAERNSATVYPPEADVYAALNLTPFSKVKVVIIGQDPYFNEGQAHGLCFSVRKGIPVPPSLMRIYKVIQKTVPGFQIPSHGFLESWAKQGVLLLNATLTVEKGKPNSHAKCGWQIFTDRIIDILNSEHSGLVFMLWGGFAQAKGAKIDKNKHFVLNAPHPSPMSGSEWNDCTHFAEANQLLVKSNRAPIDWTIPA